MKRNYLLFFYLIFLNLNISAQQIPLKGVVSIQNSAYKNGTREYVKNASVSAEFALDKLTDSEGSFMLEFVGEKIGSDTEIKVYKNGLEIVNEKALEDVIIGRTPTLNIYMCKKGELAANQLEYHNISLKNLHAERDRRIKELEKGGSIMTAEIKRLEEELNIEIHGKNDAINRLKNQIESVEKKLPDFAKKLALVNLDDASDLYIKAYQLYLTGAPHQAILLLDVNTLLEKGLGVVNDIKSLRKQRQLIDEAIAILEQQIDQTVKSLELGAELLDQQFKYQKAIKYYQAIIAIFENDPEGREEDITNCYNHIGLQFYYSGDYQNALKYFQKALEADLEIFEENHPNISRDYNNLALVYRDLGKYEIALINQQKSSEIDAIIYEENNAEVAVGLNNLAMINLALGKPNEALLAQQKALGIDIKVLEESDPNIARDYNNLSVIYQSLGQFHEALDAQQKAIEIGIENYGEINPFISKGYNNLASIYTRLGKIDIAIDMVQKALNIEEKVHSKTHPNMAFYINNLALIYRELGKFEMARDTQQKAIDIAIQAFDERHPDLAKYYGNLADINRDLGNYHQALFLHQKALCIEEQVYEKDHPSLALRYNGIAITYIDLGELEKALLNQQKAIDIEIKTYGKFHPNIAINYNNLSMIYHELGELDLALNTQQKALEISLKIHNEDHPNNARFYNNLALIYLDLKKLSKALEAEQKAIEIGLKNYEKSHPALAKNYHNLANIYKGLGKLDAALSNQLIANNIFKINYPANHYNHTLGNQSLSEIYFEIGLSNFRKKDNEEALLIFNKALKHSNKKGTINNYIGLCHYFLKNYKLAIAAYKVSIDFNPGLKRESYYNNIGTAYVKDKQFPLALKAFQAYEKRNPNDGRTFRNYAMYYALKKQPDQAINMLKKAIRLGFDDIEWLETDDSLDRLRAMPLFQDILQKMK